MSQKLSVFPNVHLYYLQCALESENGREPIVSKAKDLVPLRGLWHGVLGGQRDRAQHDHKHDEHVKHFLGHDPMNETA